MYEFNAISLIGVASDLGAEARGSNSISDLLSSVASVLSSKGLLSHEPVIVGSSVARHPDESAMQPPYYVEGVAATADSVFDVVFPAILKSRLPLLIGGDHSVSIGAVRAAACACSEFSRNLAVLWVDSHADLNTFATSPSGRAHGMALSAVIGLEGSLSSRSGQSSFAEPRNIHIFGVQSIDTLEQENVQASGVSMTGLAEIHGRGLRACISPIVRRFAEANLPIYLSIDLDVVNPQECPGVNASCASGLHAAELVELAVIVASEAPLIAIDIVEYNQTQDGLGLTRGLVIDIIDALTSDRPTWLPLPDIANGSTRTGI